MDDDYTALYKGMFAEWLLNALALSRSTLMALPVSDLIKALFFSA